MTITFLVRHPLYLRNYESVLRGLAGRGHRIHLVFSPIEKAVDRTLVDQLTADFPDQITEVAIAPRKGWWWPVSDSHRMIRDYLRYLEPEYAKAQSLVTRGGKRLPPLVQAIFRRVSVLRSKPGRALLHGLCRALERATPADPGCLEALRAWKPDLVLFTPLIDFTYNQMDYLKAAKVLGIPSVLAVASWDNLTNKGLVQIPPDRVLVWNDIQRREALSMHGLKDQTIRLTGAQLFDHWFEMAPSIDREGFCSRAAGGLFKSDKPILLYLCSSTFICRDEVSFAREWLTALRSSADPLVREANVIIRPHPAHVKQWIGVDLSEAFGAVVVWPRAGGVPVDDERKRDYFDSLHHAAAVVGINTSGFLEAGILGRRTLTLQTEHFRATQDGTLHFHYLTEGGLLTSAGTFEEHLDQLSETLADPEGTTRQVAAFIESFLRPNGLDKPATPIFIDAVEEAQTLSPKPERLPVWAPLYRALVSPLAFYARRLMLRRTNKGMWKGVEAVRSARFAPPKGQSTEHSDRKVRRFIKESGEALAAIARDDKPIIVGPWMSEVGFEILYWIPLVRWMVHQYGLSPDRIVVVSRGGVSRWYEGVGTRYLDLFDLYSPEEYLAVNSRRQDASNMQKQKAISPVEMEIVEAVKTRLGISGPVNMIHPALMYSGYLRYHWSQRSSMDHLLLHAFYDPIPEPNTEMAFEAELPQDYWAVRFYSRETFADTAENRVFVRNLLDHLLKSASVVLLDSPFTVDDHANVEWMKSGGTQGEGGNRLVVAGEWMTPANNLDVQTRIIGKSRGFVGTYGGLSYIAPLVKRPAFVFYQGDGDLSDAHINTAQTVFRDMGQSYVLIDKNAATALPLILPE
jgi:hypothetical protein